MTVNSQRVSRFSRYALPTALTVLTALYAVMLMFVSLWYEGVYSPDSLVYVNTAQNLLDSKGLTVSVVWLTEPIEASPVPPQPMRGWGPLYPALVALLALTGLSAACAALVQPLLLLPLILAGAYFASRELYGKGAAMLAVGALLHFDPLRYVTVHAWSENTALVCHFWLLYLAARMGKGKGGWRTVAGVGLLAGLATIGRFAFLPLIGIALLSLISLARNRRQAALYVFLCLSAFALIVLPVLAHNTFFVERAQSSPDSYLRTHKLAVVQFVGDGFFDSFVPEHWLVRILYAACLAIPLLALLRLLRSRTALFEGLREWLLRKNRYLVFAWPLLYMAFLAYCYITSYYLDPVGPRLTLPATITLILPLAALACWACKMPLRMAGIIALVLAIIAITAEYPVVRAIAGGAGKPMYAFDNATRNTPLLAWLDDNVAEEDLVLTPNALELSLYLGRPVYGACYESNYEFDYADLLKYADGDASRFTHRFFVVDMEQLPAQVRENKPEFLRELESGETTPYPRLKSLFQSGDKRVYELLQKPMG